MVRQLQPRAKLYFHQTWAYETDSTHPWFPQYGCDQGRMYEQIVETTRWAANSIDAALIPVGDAIQTLRQLPAFDYGNGGRSLCRDGFHLTLDYGRYAAAAVWLATTVDVEILRKPFGVFLLFTGVMTLRQTKRKK